MWNSDGLEDKFDIIIEDGLHTFTANVCFFENSIQKIKIGGYYIIEDITTTDIPIFNTKIKEWEEKYPNLTFKLVQLYNNRNSHDNLLVIQSVL